MFEFIFKKTQIIKKHESDLHRIRELNTLSRNEEIFFRLLKRTLENMEVIVSNKRFIICNSKNQPIAIFNYKDSSKPNKSVSIEREITVFTYFGMPKSEEVLSDFLSIK